jgi:hypothetical protein
MEITKADIGRLCKMRNGGICKIVRVNEPSRMNNYLYCVIASGRAYTVKGELNALFQTEYDIIELGASLYKVSREEEGELVQKLLSDGWKWHSGGDRYKKYQKDNEVIMIEVPHVFG